MKALFVSNDNPPSADRSDANTSYFRVLIPMTYLIAAGHEITHQATPPRMRTGHWVDTLDWTGDFPETVLIERMISPERVRMLRLNGARRIVLTFDDNYTLLPAYSSVAKFWKAWLPPFLEALPLVDEIIVPSRKLADDFRHRCRKITVLPNFHDPQLWEQPQRQNAKPTIGWGGSEQHLQSWSHSKIVPALKNVLRRHPDWQLVIYAPILDDFFRGAEIDADIRQWVTFERWPAEVMGFDIGLAPLAGDYDRRRSFLKPLEYAYSRVPFIATDDAPYHDLVRGGLLVRNRPQDWEEALECLITSETARRSMVALGRPWAENYMMDKRVADYEQVLWPR